VTALLPLSWFYCLCHGSTASVMVLLPLSQLYCLCHDSTASVTALLPLSQLYCLCHGSTAQPSEAPPTYSHRPSAVCQLPQICNLFCKSVICHPSLSYSLCFFSLTSSLLLSLPLSLSLPPSL